MRRVPVREARAVANPHRSLPRREEEAEQYDESERVGARHQPLVGAQDSRRYRAGRMRTDS